MKIILKLKYQNIQKRITILLKKGIIYKQLLKLSKQLFPLLNSTSCSSSSSSTSCSSSSTSSYSFPSSPSPPSSFNSISNLFSFIWIDDENDKITITSEYEIYEAIQFMKEYKNGYINLEIIQNFDYSDHYNNNNNNNNNVNINFLMDEYLNDIPLPIFDMNINNYNAEFLQCQSFLLNDNDLNKKKLTQIFTVQNIGSNLWPSKTKIIYYIQDMKVSEKWLPKYIDSNETLEVVFSTIVDNLIYKNINDNNLVSTFCSIVYINDENEEIISESKVYNIFIHPDEIFQNNDDFDFDKHRNIQKSDNNDNEQEQEQEQEEKENNNNEELMIEKSFRLPTVNICDDINENETSLILQLSTAISRQSSKDSTEYSDDEFESVSTSLRLDASTGEVIPLTQLENLNENMDQDVFNNELKEDNENKVIIQNETKEESKSEINIQLNEKVIIWKNEIELITSMGFQFDSIDNFINDLEYYLITPNSYRQQDLQLLIDHILLDQ